MKQSRMSGFLSFAKRFSRNRTHSNPPRSKRIVDIVELGSGHKTKGLLELVEPGMEVHGIDRVVRNEIIQTNSGIVQLKRGRFSRVLKRDYASESVGKFKMSIVLSYQGEPFKMAKRFRKVFQMVFEKLVPGGEFHVSEPREHLEAIKPVLESAGFNIKEFRKAEKSELTGFWQRIYSDGKTKEPWIIIATKPNPTK